MFLFLGRILKILRLYGQKRPNKVSRLILKQRPGGVMSSSASGLHSKLHRGED